jgi:hypothetical protein
MAKPVFSYGMKHEIRDKAISSGPTPRRLDHLRKRLLRNPFMGQTGGSSP